MANKVYIASSLDGYIAGKNGDLAWLESVPNPEASDFGFAEFMEGIDALVMGGNTFRTVMGFDVEWPYSKPVFVMSRSMQAIPAGYEDKAQLIEGTPAEVVATLQSQGYENLYIDGGQIIQAFLAAGLIDEMTITQFPILLGDGASLFGGLEAAHSFHLESSEVLLGALVKSRYLRR